MTNDLQVGQLRVSGIDVEIAGEADDLYFQQCVEEGTIFQPAVRVADLLLRDCLLYTSPSPRDRG